MRVGDNLYYIRNGKIHCRTLVEEDHYYCYFGREYTKVPKEKVFTSEHAASDYLDKHSGFFNRIHSWIFGSCS